MQLEIEREALKKETDSASRERLEKLEEKLANLKEKADELRAQWQAEKVVVQRLQCVREQIEQTKIEIEQAERQYDLNRAAELRYGRLAALERQLQAEEEQLTPKQGLSRLIKEEVDEIIVFHVLSEEHLKQIVEIQLGYLRKRLAERHIQIELTEAARTHLVRIGYDPTYSARPLKRAIQKEIETSLARLILQGEVRDGQKVSVDYDPHRKELQFNYLEETVPADS